MPFPPSAEVELAILRVIAGMGGEGRPQQVSPGVTSRFAQLTPADLSRTEPSGGNAWIKAIRWSRQRLVKRGELYREPRGIWRITDKGRQRIAGMPPAPSPTPAPSPPVPTPPHPPIPNGAIGKRLRDKLFQLTPEGFERVVGKFLEAMGLREVNITGRTGDGGIDGEATLLVLGIKVCFQAKRWAANNNVGIEPIQRLIGSITARKYDRGLFITTSNFTPGAREEAERPESRVVLIDGERLVALMLEKGLGVRRIPVVQEELNEAFFES